MQVGIDFMPSQPYFKSSSFQLGFAVMEDLVFLTPPLFLHSIKNTKKTI